MSVKNAVILAAGLGRRLMPTTASIPKVMISVKGKPILVNALEILSSLGIEETVIVVGHLKDFIKEKIGNEMGDMKISYIDNDFYSSTNSMYSLWMARKFIEKGTLIVEGDVFFEKSVIGDMLKYKVCRPLLCVDKFRNDLDGAMVTSDDNKKIIGIDIVKKGHPASANNYKSMGIWLIPPDYGKLLSGWLNENVKKGNVDVYCDIIIRDNLEKSPVFIHDTNGKKWVEIDSNEDIELAEYVFSK
ncbi:MAG: phosphocholine cytidylyltransferase family protein [Candidatus Aenigmarchaeota archaeon]|nr:phosphocholine cytidylyltransferase family protein [Candidatus Aenigmarchaeota archaeon]